MKYFKKLLRKKKEVVVLQRNPSTDWYIVFSVMIVCGGVVLLALTLPFSTVFYEQEMVTPVDRFSYVDRTPSGVCPTGTAVYNLTSCLKVNTPINLVLT